MIKPLGQDMIKTHRYILNQRADRGLINIARQPNGVAFFTAAKVSGIAIIGAHLT